MNSSSVFSCGEGEEQEEWEEGRREEERQEGERERRWSLGLP